MFIFDKFNPSNRNININLNILTLTMYLGIIKFHGLNLFTTELRRFVHQVKSLSFKLTK